MKKRKLLLRLGFVTFPDVSRAIGAALRFHRERAGLTVVDMAKRADLSERTIRFIEKGEIGIWANIEPLCTALQLQPDVVLLNAIGLQRTTAPMPGAPLSAEAQQLLERYLALPPEKQQVLADFAGVLTG